MALFPVPANEDQRLQALRNYEILDSIGEEEFDRITELAAIICETPIAIISLLDEQRQWFKSKIGLTTSETNRDLAFCNHTILSEAIFEVEDTHSTEQFRTNGLVTGEPHIRFYAGYPLTDSSGFALGSLCVIDREPKKLSSSQRRALELLAKEVVAAISERRQKQELRNFETLFQLSKDLICIVSDEGVFKKANPAFEAVLGWKPESLLGTDSINYIHPDDVSRAQAELARMNQGHTTVNFELRFQSQSGTYRIIQWRATPEPASHKIFAIGRDITVEKQKEQQLAESEEKMRTFFEYSHGLMCTYDLDGWILTVNRAFATTLGYTQTELLAQNVYDIVIGGKPAIERHIAELQANGSTTGVVLVWNKEGKKLVLLYNDAFVMPPDGKGYIIGNSTDITEKYELEQKLNRSQLLLEQTNRVACIGGWELNLETSELYWSKVTKEIHGVAESFQPDVNAAISFYKPDCRESIVTAIKDAIADGKPWDIELQIVTMQGKERWVRAQGNIATQHNGSKRLYGSFQDIHEKKNAEIKLKNSQKLLADVLDAATEVGIIASDTKGVVTVFNKGAEKLLGQAATEVIGKNVAKVLHFTKNQVRTRGQELTEELGYDVKGFDVFIKKSALEQSEVKEWIYKREDGATITIEMVVTAIRDENGTITGYLAVATNISELKIAKADLETLTHHLRNKNKQLLNFAQITSHNLRSPVSNLNALLSLYTDSSDPDDKEMLFEKFALVIHHLSETLDELVEALKVQEDLTQESVEVNLEECFKKVKELLAGQILESNAEVTSDFSKAYLIRYPKAYIESIMLNLFSNSIKYRALDRVPKVHFKTDIEDNQVVMQVSDNGLGIDLKRHGHKLFGLNKTFHRNPDAKGVGLFMTKMQVEAMGGEISAESEVNKGSVFTILFKNTKKS